MNPSETGKPQSDTPTLESLSSCEDCSQVTHLRIAAEVAALKARNARVEAAKGWETSFTRRILVAVCTYIVVVLFFLVADLPKPFVNALVPTVGFLLSTLSLEAVRRRWGLKK